MFNKSILHQQVASAIADPQVRVIITSAVLSTRSKNQTPSDDLPRSFHATPLALEKFDALPDVAYVRLPVLLGIFSCSKSTIWRWVKCALLPPPTKFGSRICAWNVGQLRAYLNSLQSAAKIDATGGK